MVTAASTADLAIILIDARRGVLPQTKRHSKLAHMMGIEHLVVAVNKMDLVGYDEATFRLIEADYLHFATRAGITDIRFVPMSAVNGDMVVERGERLGWYEGQTLLEILECAPVAHSEHAEAFRFPVQYVCRPQQSTDPKLHDYRGYMGRIESGEIAVGDEVAILPSGRMTRVESIHLGCQLFDRAVAGQSVTLLLEDEIDISRGDQIVSRGDTPSLVTTLRADLCWLAEAPLDPRRTYLIRHTTRSVKAKLATIHHRFDIHTLEKQEAAQLGVNDIAEVSFRLAAPLAVDPYERNRSTGAFIVIDEASNNTVGAGMILG
jgi:sulfate adenylyltransferase subunit 1